MRNYNRLEERVTELERKIEMIFVEKANSNNPAAQAYIRHSVPINDVVLMMLHHLKLEAEFIPFRNSSIKLVPREDKNDS
jgi:hypothetical protein